MSGRSKLVKHPNFRKIHRFFSKITILLLLIVLSLEVLTFSLDPSFRRLSSLFFLIEVIVLFLTLIHEAFNLRKKTTQIVSNSSKTICEVFTNLVFTVSFIEIRKEFFTQSNANAHTLHLVYFELWLIILTFSTYFRDYRLRYPLILLQYFYFKYRTMLIFQTNPDFFLENFAVLLIILILLLVELRIMNVYRALQQEIENYQTLFILSEVSTEGFAVIGQDQEIMYSSPEFKRTFLSKSDSATTKEIIGKINETKNLNNLKNMIVYRELEDLPIFSPRKHFQEKSSVLMPPKQLISTIQDSNVLLNEGVDSEENLLVKLRNKNSQNLNTSKSTFEKKGLKINIEVNNSNLKEKNGISLQDLLKKLLLCEIHEGSAETIPGISGLDLLKNSKFQGFNHITQNIAHSVPFETPNNYFQSVFKENKDFKKQLIFESKPVVYFGRDGDKDDDLFSIFVFPFKFRGKKSVFLSIRPMFKEISFHYFEKIQSFQEKFMSTMSHELRTPINGSLTLLEEILLTRNMSPESLENYLCPAICNLKIFHNTINDIFDFSKLYLNSFELNLSEVNLSSLISEIARLMKPLSRRKGLEILINQDPKLPKRIFSDPVRIRQILLNLLTNSLRFTSKGSITINMKLNSTELLEICVIDTGTGMSEEKQKSLFKMTVSNEGGTVGFGLTISNLIAKELNSEKKGLIIQSKVGQGCSVSFNVSFGAEHEFAQSSPMLQDNYEINEKTQHKCISLREIDMEKKFFDYIKHKSEQAEMVQQEKDSLFPQKIKKCPCFNVLIVDDNEFNLMALRLLIQRQGLSVEEARNGEEAVRKITKNLEKTQKLEHHCHYKLVFMDLDMPIKNGFEASEELMVAFSNFDVNIPIIACTAFQENMKEKCLKMGMSGFITKPIASNELEKILKEHLNSELIT